MTSQSKLHSACLYLTTVEPLISWEVPGVIMIPDFHGGGGHYLIGDANGVFGMDYVDANGDSNPLEETLPLTASVDGLIEWISVTLTARA